MQVILKETVDGLGQIGDLVTVKPGYARNFLIPKALAIVANVHNIKEIEHQKRQLARKLQLLAEKNTALKEKIEACVCTFAHRCGEDGKLFGSVTSQEIAAKLAESGIELDRKRIQLDEPIKALGEYEVVAKLDAGVVATIKVVVNASE